MREDSFIQEASIYYYKKMMSEMPTYFCDGETGKVIVRYIFDPDVFGDASVEYDMWDILGQTLSECDDYSLMEKDDLVSLANNLEEMAQKIRTHING